MPRSSGSSFAAKDAPRQALSTRPGGATTFDEITAGLSDAEAVREARRCIQCDCLAKDTCGLRRYGTEYAAEPGKYKGERRAFARDASHPEIVYESGKCILCGLCVRIAEQEGERPGITFEGRGFPTVAAIPFDRPVAEGLARIRRAVRGGVSHRRAGDEDRLQHGGTENTEKDEKKLGFWRSWNRSSIRASPCLSVAVRGSIVMSPC